MSLFEFCLEIILREGTKLKVGVNTTVASQITAANRSDINFDNANNRCSYLYRCGTITLTFARDCFKKFLSNDQSLVLLLAKWINCPELTVCSITNGPGLDYIALLIAYQECGMFPSLFKNITVISKHGAWRNTVNVMLEVLKEGFLKCLPPSVPIGNIEVIQGDPFVELNEKIKVPIGSSDIVLMVKTLNLQTDGWDKIRIPRMLQEFLGALKPGAVLFCIDTKPSVAVITHQLCSFAGSYLFEPNQTSTKFSVENADTFKNIFGCFPVVSAKGTFFVWQKSSAASLQISESLNDELSEIVKRLHIVDKDCNKLPENHYSEQVASSSTDFSKNNSLCNINKNLNPTNLKSAAQDILCSGDSNQNSKYFHATSTSESITLAHDCAKKENIGLSKKPPTTVVNKAVQTDPEDIKGPESVQMIELSNKIAKLTTTLSEMLQMDECKSDGSLNLKDVETELIDPVSDDCFHSHCSSVTPCNHSCSCRKLAQSVENCCSMCKCWKQVPEYCCHHHVCQQEQFTLNRCSSSASLNGNSEASRCGTSCENRVKFSAENNSTSTPKLVIPLSNLSGNVVSQILTLLSQSNQE